LDFLLWRWSRRGKWSQAGRLELTKTVPVWPFTVPPNPTEDQDPVRVLLCRQLRNLGYTVLEAASGAAALRIAAEHKGDLHLLLTDVILEGMNGRELYDILARERGGIRVLYMSAYTKGVPKEYGVASEGMDFIQKPFDMHALATKVREVLDQS
jgi:CheY-like chemotaxis protein